ncbi:MAG TPA: SRPBCC family protein [Thermomicrobiales bacterium]|nr:SRPBCC family protein [Thermomicrobiales bacterium]
MSTTENTQLTQTPVATAAMLIRRPAAEVFEAIVDPAITSKFWFTKGSGRLEPGATVRWDWEMYGVFANVAVKQVEPNRRILMEWWSGDETPTTVEWRFTPHGDDTTFLEAANSGFSGDADSVVAQALDSTGGFTLVVAGLKAWLEHGIQLNLVPDRFPTRLGEH